jgi:hypothetical protein
VFKCRLLFPEPARSRELEIMRRWIPTGQGFKNLSTAEDTA